MAKEKNEDKPLLNYSYAETWWQGVSNSNEKIPDELTRKKPIVVNSDYDHETLNKEAEPDITNRFICMYCGSPLYDNGEIHDPRQCYRLKKKIPHSESIFSHLSCGNCGQPAFRHKGAKIEIHRMETCSYFDFENETSRKRNYVSLLDIDNTALNALGWMYLDGQGVGEADPKKAFDFFQKAADQDNIRAQYSLGWMFYKGKGVKEADPKKAFDLLQKAADQDYAHAQCHLGLLYNEGKGVERADPEKAVHWYKKAANQGHALAQFSLGVMYNEGKGVELADPKEAVYWYKKAADQGHFLAQTCLGVMYNEGKGVKRADPEKAVYWYKKQQTKTVLLHSVI